MGAIRVERLSKRLYYQEQSARSFWNLLRVVSGFASPQQAFWALRDVSLEVEPGDLLGIVGPNGAGKSTLLKVVDRIYAPTEGRVATEGRVVPLLFIGAGFHPDLTGRDNVYQNAAVLDFPRSRARAVFDEIVDFSGIERFIDIPVKYYSSGMFVRLAFAIAVHCEPDVLLTDEILAVGDIGFQTKCLERFDLLRRNGCCGLFVSHIPAMVIQFCREAIYLEAGEVRARGASPEVVQAYVAAGAGHVETDSGPIRVLSLSATSGNGEEVLRWGRPARLETILEARDALDAVAVDIGLFGLSSAVPVAWGTSEADRPGMRIAPGKHRFAAEIRDLTVWPGSYYLQVRVRTGRKEVLPWSFRSACTVAPAEEEDVADVMRAHTASTFPRQVWTHRRDG